jgi:hypothetical protein
MLLKKAFQAWAPLRGFLHPRYGKPQQNSSSFRPGIFIFLKEWYHVHMDAVEKPCLMDGYVDSMVTGLEQEIGLFRGFNPDWQEYRPSAGGADTEITVPLADVCKDFRNNRNLLKANAILGMGKHDADIIESVQ